MPDVRKGNATYCADTWASQLNSVALAAPSPSRRSRSLEDSASTRSFPLLRMCSGFRNAEHRQWSLSDACLQQGPPSYCASSFARESGPSQAHMACNKPDECQVRNSRAEYIQYETCACSTNSMCVTYTCVCICMSAHVLQQGGLVGP